MVIKTNCPICLYYPVYYQESGEEHIYKDCRRCGDFILTICAKKYTGDIEDREKCSRYIRISKNKNFNGDDIKKYAGLEEDFVNCCTEP